MIGQLVGNVCASVELLFVVGLHWFHAFFPVISTDLSGPPVCIIASSSCQAGLQQQPTQASC